jgi:hypothetical protein
MQQMASQAYRKGEIGDVAGIDFFKTQNVFTHTVGTKAGTPVVNGGAQGVAYTSVLNTESVPGHPEPHHLRLDRLFGDPEAGRCVHHAPTCSRSTRSRR